MSYVDHKAVALACPRNFAKTSILGFFYVLFVLCEQLHKQVVIVGESLEKAKETLEKIRTELEENDSLREWYGNLVGTKRWTTECLILANKTCVIAKGYGQSLRGTNIMGRPTLIICDDMEDDEQVLNEDRRKKFEQWFFGVVRPALAHPDTSQMVMIGTLLHPEAFLTRMTRGEFPGWRTNIYRALIADENGGHKSLWPDKFSVETLLAEREMSPLFFAHEYMNEPISDESRIFREEWIRSFKDDEVPVGRSIYITCDPSLGANDYTAIVVVAVDHEKKMYVLEATQQRILPKDIINTLYEKAIKYRPKAIGIEETAFQKTLIYDMQDTFRKNPKAFNVIPLKSLNQKKEFRVKSLQPKFQNGEIFFRPVGQEELIRQIKFYTAAGAGTKYDDLIDALAYQVQIIGPGKKKPVDELKDKPFNTYAIMRKAIDIQTRRWGSRSAQPHKLSQYGRR